MKQNNSKLVGLTLLILLSFFVSAQGFCATATETANEAALEASPLEGSYEAPSTEKSYAWGHHPLEDQVSELPMPAHKVILAYYLEIFVFGQKFPKSYHKAWNKTAPEVLTTGDLVAGARKLLKRHKKEARGFLQHRRPFYMNRKHVSNPDYLELIAWNPDSGIDTIIHYLETIMKICQTKYPDHYGYVPYNDTTWQRVKLELPWTTPKEMIYGKPMLRHRSTPESLFGRGRFIFIKFLTYFLEHKPTLTQEQKQSIEDMWLYYFDLRTSPTTPSRTIKTKLIRVGTLATGVALTYASMQFLIPVMAIMPDVHAILGDIQTAVIKKSIGLPMRSAVQTTDELDTGVAVVEAE